MTLIKNKREKVQMGIYYYKYGVYKYKLFKIKTKQKSNKFLKNVNSKFKNIGKKSSNNDEKLEELKIKEDKELNPPPYSLTEKLEEVEIEDRNLGSKSSDPPPIYTMTPSKTDYPMDEKDIYKYFVYEVVPRELYANVEEWYRISPKEAIEYLEKNPKLKKLDSFKDVEVKPRPLITKPKPKKTMDQELLEMFREYEEKRILQETSKSFLQRRRALTRKKSILEKIQDSNWYRKQFPPDFLVELEIETHNKIASDYLEGQDDPNLSPEDIIKIKRWGKSTNPRLKWKDAKKKNDHNCVVRTLGSLSVKISEKFYLTKKRVKNTWTINKKVLEKEDEKEDEKSIASNELYTTDLKCSYEDVKHLDPIQEQEKSKPFKKFKKFFKSSKTKVLSNKLETIFEVDPEEEEEKEALIEENQAEEQEENQELFQEEEEELTLEENKDLAEEEYLGEDELSCYEELDSISSFWKAMKDETDVMKSVVTDTFMKMEEEYEDEFTSDEELDLNTTFWKAMKDETDVMKSVVTDTFMKMEEEYEDEFTSDEELDLNTTFWKAMKDETDVMKSVVPESFMMF